MIRFIRIGVFVALLSLSTLSILAQDSDELPEIDYVRSPSGYNVPVLNGDWQSASTNDTTIFTNDTINARIVVASINTTDESEAIARVLDEQFSNAATLPDAPLYQDIISLNSGVWTQEIYQVADITASALATFSRGSMRVIAFVEDNPDANIYQLIVRAPEPADDATDTETGSGIDSAIGVEVALETLFSDSFDAVPQTRTTIDLVSGSWQRTRYESNTDEALTTFGFAFQNVIYTTITSGDATDGAVAADAFNTIFLGFFTTPQTGNYLNLGLIAVAVIFGIFLVSLFWRYRNAQKDLELIEQLEDQS